MTAEQLGKTTRTEMVVTGGFSEGDVFIYDVFKQPGLVGKTCLKAALEGTPFTLRTLHNLEAAPAERPILIIYPAAEETIAEALGMGQTAANALAEWETLITQMLNFQKAHRRRCFLIEADAFHPEHIDHLCSRLGAWLGSQLSQVKMEQESGQEVAALPELIAVQSLQQSRRARRMTGELAAGGYAPRRRAVLKTQNLEQILEEMRYLRAAGTAERDVLAAQLSETRTGMEALVSRLSEREAALREAEAAMAAFKKEASARRVSLKEDLAQQRQRINQLDHERADLEQLMSESKALNQKEKTLLQQQITALQNELETLHKAYLDQGRTLEETETDRTHVKNALAEAEAHVQALHDSTSWRVTRPMRAVRLMLSKSQ